MLDYAETVLEKVSFNRELFRNELEKSIKWLKKHEVQALKARAAGAHWVGPYKADKAEGPKIIDTRPSTPPAVQDTPRPGPDSLSASDIVRPKSSGSALYANQYLLGPRFWKSYQPRQFYPHSLYGFKPFGTGRFWGGSHTGRGYISAGRGFRRGHGSPGRGFKGGSFRRR